MKDKWSFKYRGNGYGYFKTKAECVEKAKDKRISDKSKFTNEFGTPPAIIFYGDMNKNLIAIDQIDYPSNII